MDYATKSVSEQMFICKWLIYRCILNHGFLGLQDFTDL